MFLKNWKKVKYKINETEGNIINHGLCRIKANMSMEEIVKVAAGGKIYSEAIPSNLDLHSDIPTQVGVQSAFYVYINPINTIDASNDITFKIPSTLNHVIRPSKTRQRIKFQIKKFKGNVAAEGNKGGGLPCWRRTEKKFKVKQAKSEKESKIYDHIEAHIANPGEFFPKDLAIPTALVEPMRERIMKTLFFPDTWDPELKTPEEAESLKELDPEPVEVALEENQVIPVNNIVQSLWKNIGVSINNQNLFHANALYAYKADMETKLMTTKEGKKNLKIGGWYEEKEPWDKYRFWEGKKDRKKEKKKVPIDWVQDFPTLFEPKAGVDPALQHRYGFTHNETTKGVWEVAGPIHSEIFEINRVLPPNTEVVVNMIKQHINSFYTLTTNKDNEYTYLIDILEMQLEVHYLTVDPAIIQEMIYETKRKAYVYSLRSVTVRWFNNPAGITDINHFTMLAEKTKLPRRIFIGFVDNQAFSGHQNKDPFYYQFLKMKSSGLTVGNGQRPYPNLRYQPPELTQGMLAFQDATSGTFSDEYTGYDAWDLVNKNFLLCYKLSPTDSVPGECYEMLPAETVTFNASLEEPTKHVMIMLVYSEYDAEMLIDENGRVTVS